VSDDIDLDDIGSGDVDVDCPATWTPPAPTGVASVDEALIGLSDLDGLPIAEHVAVYDRVHKQLQDSLADLDGR
jgi:hypothetical protein